MALKSESSAKTSKFSPGQKRKNKAKMSKKNRNTKPPSKAKSPSSNYAANSRKRKAAERSVNDHKAENRGKRPRSRKNKPNDTAEWPNKKVFKRKHQVAETTDASWVVGTSMTKKPIASVGSALEAAGGFDWNATAQDLALVTMNTPAVESDSENSGDDIPIKRKKLTAAEKRAKALQDEKTLKKKERELLEAEDNPQSPDHFERLLVGSPNSAELWIKYIGYHAVNAEIDKARAVALRAIKKINPQVATAKLDVWIAFLNLDYTFSPPEVFKETFSEALKSNDDYAINSRVLNLYADSKNVSEVNHLCSIMIRKYKDKLKNWLQCQNAFMTVGLHEKARSILQKALATMSKKEHVTLISRFALLENKHGFPEQAQALFENLLTSFPQRLDLLSVYVDMLVKSDSKDLARSALERAASNTLPVRKMKSIYMKWLAFEQAYGSPAAVAKVEEAAKKFVTVLLHPGKKAVVPPLKQEHQVKDEDLDVKCEKPDFSDADLTEDDESDG